LYWFRVDEYKKNGTANQVISEGIEATLSLMWFGHHCKHTILIVSYVAFY